jgi:hypothetical protein
LHPVRRPLLCIRRTMDHSTRHCPCDLLCPKGSWR